MTKKPFMTLWPRTILPFCHSAVIAMGDNKLKVIAVELITQVKKSVTIDWTLRESARAKIMGMVRAKGADRKAPRRCCR